MSGTTPLLVGAPSNVPSENLERRPRLEEDFRLLVTSVKDYAIYMIDREGYIVSWNLGAARLKGYSEAEIIGRNFSTFYPPEEVEAGKPRRELELALRDGRVEDEGWRVRKDGTRFWANVVITALFDAQGVHRGYAKVTRDLTEQKRAEEDRLRLAQAQEAVRLRDEFLSIASHELRTPLNSLSLSLQGLQLLFGDTDTTARERIEKARRQLQRLVDLVTRLLDVSRISEGKVQLVLQPTDLASVVASSVEGLRTEASLKGCDLELAAPAELPATVDRLRIEQLITNVLDNAIKYGQGKPVRVTLSREDDVAVISVRDNGVGIAEQDLERIFWRFEQAVPQRNVTGLGLGLYISRQIAERHGGSIHVESAPGAGSTFTIKLPLAPEPR